MRYVIAHEGLARLYVSTDNVGPSSSMALSVAAMSISLPPNCRFYLWELLCGKRASDISYPAVLTYVPGYYGPYSTKVDPIAPIQGCRIVLGAYKPGSLVKVTAETGSPYMAECERVVSFNSTGKVVGRGALSVSLIRPLDGGGNSPVSPAAVLSESYVLAA